ncbi:RluA family pseudouridine synthase [bacterium]|nr:RluA family pseudouridine synthase [bacterium]
MTGSKGLTLNKTLQESARLRVVDEGEDYLVVDKPGDLVCHPTTGDEFSSLISRVRLYLGECSPHFVNRLDRETSGLVLISKSNHKKWCGRFESARKVYWTIVQGWPAQDEGLIEAPIGPLRGSLVRLKQAVVPDGKAAITSWRVLRRLPDRLALLEVVPETGRMHQIRVHLSYIGHPVLGDKIYGPDESFFVEFLDHGWTPRLEQQLRIQRHLLSAVEMQVGEFHWRVDPPQDISSMLA